MLRLPLHHSTEELMQIGDLAREAGEDDPSHPSVRRAGSADPCRPVEGSLSPVRAESLVRIRWIGKLQEMGFSLGDIQTIVREGEGAAGAPDAMKRVREAYARQLEAKTREQRRRLEALEHELAASLPVPRHMRRVRSAAPAVGLRVLRLPRQGNRRARAGASGPRALRKDRRIMAIKLPIFMDNHSTTPGGIPRGPR